MTDDDPTGDDLQLRQMRSVWLSMRDDDAEPSDRGMAALLSAAREKAEEMKPRASWWSRLLEQLRRPPVLALATVVVLVGGAVVISTQRSKDEARMEVVSETSAPSISSPAAPPQRDSNAMGDDARSQPQTAAPAPTAASAPAASSSRPEEPARPRVEREASRGAPKAATKVTTEPPPSDVPAPDPTPAAEKADEERFATPPPASTTMELAADSLQAGGAANEQPQKKPVTRKPLPAIEGEDRTGTKTKDAATIATLVKQCEVAAAKNDCASVRAIAARIAKQDPATYKTKLENNATVQRCLEMPPASAASPD